MGSTKVTAYARRVAERDLLRDALREFHAFVQREMEQPGARYSVEQYLAWPEARCAELRRLL